MLRNTRKVAILLSSYNGEQYIRDQIDSIINQDFVDWTLYIRDDGSIDNTQNIINEYTKLYDNIVWINEDNNLGAMNSFFRLLDIVDSEYYMFCDQDDYWLPFKISKTLNELQNLENEHIEKPALIGTNLIVADSELNVVSTSLFDYIGFNHSSLAKYPYMLYVTNPFVGCTLMFNRLCKTVLIPPSPNAIMHDWWLVLNILRTGVVYIIPETTIMYRQHANNVVGTRCINYNSIEYWFFKIKKISLVYKRNVSIIRMLYDLNICPAYKYLIIKIKYIIGKL